MPVLEKNMELKTIRFKADSVSEVKALQDGGEEFYEVKGYATKWDGVDSYGDTIRRGAYLKTIQENPDGFPALFMHDSYEMPVGQWFKLEEDNVGLLVTARLPKSDTFVSGRLVPQMKAGSIDALSIGYWIEKASEEIVDGESVRVLEIIKLREISFITKGYQADGGALLTELKNRNTKDVFNMMVEAKRKDCTPELKSEIIEYYHEKGMDSPFDDGAVMSIDEMKSLGKSNMAYAIRNLSLSAKTANYLAELVGVSLNSLVKGSEGDDNADSTGTVDSTKEADSKSDNSEEGSVVDGETETTEESGKSETLEDLISFFKSNQTTK